MSTSQQPPAASNAAAAGVELCALLQQLHKTSELTYEQLAERTHLSRGTVNNYLAKPTHRRGTRALQQLLDALGAAAPDRAHALDLHRRTLPSGADPTLMGWRARARAAGCTVWSMLEFTAPEASVHPAIGPRIGPANQHPTEVWPPAYVPRAYDEALRADIAAAAAGELRALIVLRGTSSTGKTRSLWEAVRELCPSWTVIRPRSAAAARGLPEAGLWDRPVVVWLNELQGFLAPHDDGLSVDVLRDLYAEATTPVVLVGTLWPDKLHDATGGGRDEARSEARELLSGLWVRWHEVAPTLITPAEQAAAREAARSDPRLARAVQDPDRVGFAQTLAGSCELLEHYHAAPTMARLLLEAAADAHRLGHAHAQNASLLEAMTRALWDESRAPTLPVDGWFSGALAYATRPVRSADGPRALIPISDRKLATNPYEESSEESCAGAVGYALADYLEQHLFYRRRLRPVHDKVWSALAAYTSHSEDLIALSDAASDRGRYDHTEVLRRRVAAVGDSRALGALTWWLSQLPGREADVEAVYREAAAAGDLDALRALAEWLKLRSGREADVEAVYREAIAAGDPKARRQLGEWLWDLPGREADVEAVYREAMAAGDPEAFRQLAQWLDWPPGREADVETVYREAAAAGDPAALREWAGWLRHRPGREADVEAFYREAIATGDSAALYELAWWLRERPGRETSVEALFRAAIAVDGQRAVGYLAWWLALQAGRESDAETVLREAAAAGDQEALSRLAFWLSQWGRQSDADVLYDELAAAGDADALKQVLGRDEDEVEAACRRMAAAGDRDALLRLARYRGSRQKREAEVANREMRESSDPLAPMTVVKWPSDRPDWEADTEAAFREATAAGVPHALSEFARWLTTVSGREAHAEATYREAAANNPYTLLELAIWLGGRPGREADAEIAYREAAASGYPTALDALADWLAHQPGREADAEQTSRDAIVAGSLSGLYALTKWLISRGRKAEADLVRQFGLDSHGRTINPNSAADNGSQP